MSHPASRSPTPNAARTPRLRSRRITIEADQLGKVRASAHHADLGALAGDVLDLSSHGLALTLPAKNNLAEVLFNGDRLESLVVTAGETVLYRGSGTIRRVSEEPERQVLGIEVEGIGIDLGEFYRRGARNSFAQRWAQLELSGRWERVSPEFKAFVADMRSKLESVREFLIAEENALAPEDRRTREETSQQYLEELRPRMFEEMYAGRAELARLVGGLTEEEHSEHRAYLRSHLLHLFAESPFMRRSYEKPLGYAGDYEMMNMLYRDHAEGDTLFGKLLNLYVTHEDAARANINRIDYLGAKFREIIAESGAERVRIASIGCGPSHEIAAFCRNHPELAARLDVALIDQEDRAISYCERTLTPLIRSTGIRVQFIRESIRRLLTTRQLANALGERDFIYSAGLFDYLADRSFGALLSTLWSATAPGGRMAIGNVALHNPSRWIMEYCLDWFLHHRTEEELLAQGRALNPAASSVEVEAEPTGVNLFLLLRR